MITIDPEQTAISADQFTPTWETCYTTSQVYIRLGAMIQADSVSDTRSVLALTRVEEDLNPYECVRSSSILAFWDSEEEDIYSFDDGEPA
jgi:hypothetical protein